MKKIFILLLILELSLCNYAQQITSFKPLRYNEDYSYLKKDSSDNWYNKTKYLPLSKDGYAYISMGGELRYQYFYYKNQNWGESPEDKDGYILTRYLFHADFHLGKYIRSFVQLQSSLANGKVTVPSTVDENQLDIHQAFLDITLPGLKQQKLILRLGRQEMLYGTQRLVSVRDGPNNRQSFDAAKLIYSTQWLTTDLFYSHYTLSTQKIFDDGFNKNTKFWGGYAVINKVPVLKNMDVYYFGLWKSLTSFDDGKETELRHSVGSRVWNKSHNWEYDFEGVYQWGKFGKGNISAWTLSSNTTYTFVSAKFKPQINLKTELISGDKTYNDSKLNTFNALFPRGTYFGYAAIIGPANLIDIHPALTMSLTRKLDLGFDYDAFWRYSINDGIYGPAVNLIYSGKNISEKFIGQQYSTFLNYNPNKILYLRGEFTWFKAGAFLKEAGPGKNILFTGITTQLKF